MENTTIVLITLGSQHQPLNADPLNITDVNMFALKSTVPLLFRRVCELYETLVLSIRSLSCSVLQRLILQLLLFFPA